MWMGVNVVVCIKARCPAIVDENKKLVFGGACMPLPANALMVDALLAIGGCTFGRPARHTAGRCTSNDGWCIGNISAQWCETLCRQTVTADCYALNRQPQVHMKSITGNCGQCQRDHGCRRAHLYHAWVENNNVTAAGHDLRSRRPIARRGKFPGVSGTMASVFLLR